MSQNNPETSPELLRRMPTARRDHSSLCVHYTRGAPASPEMAAFYERFGLDYPDTPAGTVLSNILYDGAIDGRTAKPGTAPVVCFTEAPIHEFANLFALSKLATDDKDRLRYEPYGIAVSKSWLFRHGGRPVIYDHIGIKDTLPRELQYRLVDYDASNPFIVSREREWRVRTERLELEPKEALVVVPSAQEAFELAAALADRGDSFSEDGDFEGTDLEVKWRIASLELFGYQL